MGSGAFGATRGKYRLHEGEDYVFAPGADVLSPVQGVVTKLGYPYGLTDKQNRTSYRIQFRYVQVTDSAGNLHRLFYVSPDVQVGDNVLEGVHLGVAQPIIHRISLDGRTYGARGMKNHVHYEILDREGVPQDPEVWHAS